MTMFKQRFSLIAIVLLGVSVLFASLVFTPGRTYGQETDTTRPQASAPLPPQAPLDAPTSAVDPAEIVTPPSAGDAGLAAGLDRRTDQSEIAFIVIGLGFAMSGFGALLTGRVRSR